MPMVDRIAGSRLHNMKELRPSGSTIRILFCFDPRRTAILLLGGNKADAWEEWYAISISHAELLYNAYPEELRKEGLL
jgi:hypothetical protein